jgi:hypothetical protein
VSDVLLERELAAVRALGPAHEQALILRGLRHKPGGNPHNQQDHAGGGAKSVVQKAVKAAAKTGQAALDAAPAKLKRAPKGQQGNYEGEDLTGPPGMGEVRALSQYQGVEYQRVNNFLRGGYDTQPGPGALPDNPPDFMRLAADITTEIDKTMSVSRLADDVHVDRVIRHGAQVFGNSIWYGDMDLDSTDDLDEQDRRYDRWIAGERPDLTGMQWVDHGYQSTTARPGVVEEFGGDWRKYNKPDDGEPIILNMLVPKGTGGVQLSELDHEAEILLERGLIQEIVADHGVGADGFRRLDVRVVGRHGDS